MASANPYEPSRFVDAARHRSTLQLALLSRYGVLLATGLGEEVLQPGWGTGWFVWITCFVVMLVATSFLLLPRSFAINVIAIWFPFPCMSLLLVLIAKPLMESQQEVAVHVAFIALAVVFSLAYARRCDRGESAGLDFRVAIGWMWGLQLAWVAVGVLFLLISVWVI